jgi:uncharacterized protein
MYMYTAMADLAADLGDESLKAACERLWEDVTSKRMYVTAGLGPSASNEGFTRDYDLPNDTAYAETCASVALIFWAQRMLNLDCDGKYADVLELALYNGALAGLSYDGTHYFYENKLESDGSHRRWEWHPCPCCTMNVSRLVASVGGYFYSSGEDVLVVHLYGGNSASVSIGGRRVGVKETSSYPWSGATRIAIEPEAPAEFALKLRIPGWAQEAKIRVNGREVDGDTAVDRGYADIRRTWSPGDVVELDLSMPVERIFSHPNVRADIGRVCLKRGPLVYCVEEADNKGAAIERIKLPRGAQVETVERPDLFDGILTVMAEGREASAEDWNGALYRPEPPVSTARRLTAIPYYLWSNREPGRMLVWIPEC